MSLRGAQNIYRVIREYEPQQVCEPDAILRKMAQQRRGMFTKRNVLGCRFSLEPLVFAKERKNVVRMKRIFAYWMRLNVLRRGHEGILAQLRNPEICFCFSAVIQRHGTDSVAMT